MTTIGVRLPGQRPVEGCLVKAQGIVRSADLAPREDVELRWRYLRLGSPAANCANEACELAYDYEPSTWARRVASGAQSSALQCVACLKRGGVARDQLTFCSPRCFAKAWPRHKDRWHSLPLQRRSRVPSFSSTTSSSPPPKLKSRDEDADARDNTNSGHPAAAAAGNNNNDDDPLAATLWGSSSANVANGARPYVVQQRWETVAEGAEASYRPTRADVGRRLRVECYGIAVKGAPQTTPAPGDAEWRSVCGPRDDASLAAFENFRGPKGLLTTEVVLSRPSPNAPRRWFGDQDEDQDEDQDDEVHFRIATYNVLAEIYATPQYYPYCPRFALHWPYRGRRIVDELAEADADVICLQEAQRDHYDRDISPALDELGYDGVFSQKTRETIPGKVDGCAIFWKRVKFRLAEHRALQFNDVARAEATALRMSERDEHAFLVRLVKDNVAQFAVFEAYDDAPPRHPPYGQPRRASDTRARRVCVANTHLYSNASFPDTKLWQTLAFANELDRFVTRSRERLPVVICGDFNSQPTSAVYDLLSTGQVDPHHDDLHPPLSTTSNNAGVQPASSSSSKPTSGLGGGNANAGGRHAVSAAASAAHPHHHHHHQQGQQQQKNPRSNVLPDTRDITHRLNLASAYHAALGAEPLFTNYTLGFRGTSLSRCPACSDSSGMGGPFFSPLKTDGIRDVLLVFVLCFHPHTAWGD